MSLRSRTEPRICSGERRPWKPGRPRVTRPEWTAGPPSSSIRTCEFSSASSSSPGSREDPQRDLVRHRRGRDEDGLLLAEQRGAAALELEHGRVLALLLVADDRLGDRPAHLGRRLGERVGAEVDHARKRYRGGVDLAILDSTLAARGEPAYRAAQVWEWAARGAPGYDEMTNLPAPLRDALAGEVPFSTLTVDARRTRRRTARSRRSSAPHDGHPVEAVLMRYRDGRRSLCLSSQSGCPLTCTFCATGPDAASAAT